MDNMDELFKELCKAMRKTLVEGFLQSEVSELKDKLKEIGIDVDIKVDINNIDLDKIERLANERFANDEETKAKIEESQEAMPQITSEQLERYFAEKDDNKKHKRK